MPFGFQSEFTTLNISYTSNRLIDSWLDCFSLSDPEFKVQFIATEFFEMRNFFKLLFFFSFFFLRCRIFFLWVNFESGNISRNIEIIKIEFIFTLEEIRLRY